jgi:hypothetical protein
MIRSLIARSVLRATVVVGAALFAVVAAFVFYAHGYGGHFSRVKNTKTLIQSVQEALAHYRVDHANSCPPSPEALVVEHYLTRVPRDEWGQPLRLICPGSHDSERADIASAGRDRRFGTSDDINSWEL